MDLTSSGGGATSNGGGPPPALYKTPSGNCWCPILCCLLYLIGYKQVMSTTTTEGYGLDSMKHLDSGRGGINSDCVRLQFARGLGACSP